MSIARLLRFQRRVLTPTDRPTNLANHPKRYYRTIFLGIAAMAVLIWSAMDQFGIPAAELRGFFLAVLVGVGGIILLAGVLVLVWALLRKVFARVRR